MSLSLKDIKLTGELIRGLKITLRYMFKPSVTIQYPTQRREASENYRGLIRWDKDKCVACVLCEYFCPAKAIDITTGEDEAGNKKVLNYQVDASHCMYCGYCVEICPVKAIKHSEHFELSVYELEDTIYAQEKMAGDPPITKYR